MVGIENKVYRSTYLWLVIYDIWYFNDSNHIFPLVTEHVLYKSTFYYNTHIAAVPPDIWYFDDLIKSLYV